MKAPRMQQYVLDGVTYTAPAIWIAGRTTRYIQVDKLPPREAFGRALADWAETDRLRQQYEAEDRARRAARAQRKAVAF